jgi:hypothetical protein
MYEDIPEDEAGQKLQKDAAYILCWYLDVYLPAAVGDMTFGKTLRYYKKQTDSTLVHGKQRVLVEAQQEAFGWLVLDNCHEKWQTIIPAIHVDPHFKVPKWNRDDPNTHAYHVTKYTDPRGGQSAGWKAEARQTYQEYIDIIKARRQADKDKTDQGTTHYQDLLKWLRQARGITTDAPVPKSRKRKRPKTATVNEDEFVTLDDESECDFSVHSEGGGDTDDDDDEALD